MGCAKTLIGTALLGATLLAGCGLPIESAAPFKLDKWATYTSPDGRVSFEHPANLDVQVRPRRDEIDPDLALFMSSGDQAFGLTLVVRISPEPMPDYERSMLDSLADGSTVATTKPEEIELNGAKGLRQEFKSGTSLLADDLIVVGLRKEPVYVSFSCNCRSTRRDELREACQRVVDSLRILPAGSDLAAQTQGE